MGSDANEYLPLDFASGPGGGEIELQIEKWKPGFVACGNLHFSI
jgi:hypothetical protein